MTPPPSAPLPNHRISSGERCAASPHRQPSERGTGEGRGEERRLPLRRGVPGGAQGRGAAPGPGSCLKAERGAARRCFPRVPHQPRSRGRRGIGYFPGPRSTWRVFWKGNCAWGPPFFPFLAEILSGSLWRSIP